MARNPKPAAAAEKPAVAPAALAQDPAKTAPQVAPDTTGAASAPASAAAEAAPAPVDPTPPAAAATEVQPLADERVPLSFVGPEAEGVEIEIVSAVQIDGIDVAAGPVIVTPQTADELVRAGAATRAPD